MRGFRTLHFLPSSGGFDVHFFHKHDNATKLNRGLRQKFEVERVVLNALTEYIAHHGLRNKRLIGSNCGNRFSLGRCLTTCAAPLVAERAETWPARSSGKRSNILRQV